MDQETKRLLSETFKDKPPGFRVLVTGWLGDSKWERTKTGWKRLELQPEDTELL